MGSQGARRVGFLGPPYLRRARECVYGCATDGCIACLGDPPGFYELSVLQVPHVPLNDALLLKY